jgi:hypothetical protein
MIALAAGVGLFVLALAASAPAADEPRPITIATGSVSGIYYPVGGSICRLVNRRVALNGLYCGIDVTSGSATNIGLLLEGFNAFAIVQSDVLAKLGSLPLAADPPIPPDAIRAVLRLHPEVMTIVVRADSGLVGLADLKRRRIAAGEAGSGHASTFEFLRKVAGWSAADSAGVIELATELQAEKLCERSIDAFVNVVGHPNPSVIHASELCAISILALDPEVIGAATSGGAGIDPVTLPRQVYGPVPASPVRSIGTHAVLVTTSGVASATVGSVVGAVVGNFDEWRRMHPALERLVQADLSPAALPAAPHEAAIAALEAVGR